MFYAINQEALLIASPIATILAALIGAVIGSIIKYLINKKNIRNQLKSSLMNDLIAKTNGNPTEILKNMKNHKKEYQEIIKEYENLDKN